MARKRKRRRKGQLKSSNWLKNTVNWKKKELMAGAIKCVMDGKMGFSTMQLNSIAYQGQQRIDCLQKWLMGLILTKLNLMPEKDDLSPLSEFLTFPNIPPTPKSSKHKKNNGPRVITRYPFVDNRWSGCERLCYSLLSRAHI